MNIEAAVLCGGLLLVAALIASIHDPDPEPAMPNLPRQELCISYRIIGLISFAVLAALIVGLVRRFPRVAIVMLVVMVVSCQMALAEDKHHSNPWLLSWIPATCCVTNDCCWEISSSEVQPLPNDEWRVLATGQERKRTDWSPDGKYYRCACDYDQASKHWIRHQGANTRCIFVPMQSAKRHNP